MDGDQKVKLDDLPESGNKDFWLDADIHTGITPHDEFASHGHYFERIRGHQAQCSCGWGFELDPGDYIREGHLYTKSNKLVI